MRMKKYVLTAAVLAAVLAFSSCIDVKITSAEEPSSGQQSAILGGNFQQSPEIVVTDPPAGGDSDTPSGGEQEDTPDTPRLPSEMSREQLLNYFNSSLNDVKISYPGFKRTKLTTVNDIKLSNSLANQFVSMFKSALLSEDAEEKTASKGSSSEAIANMSPDTERYVSNLMISDIENITLATAGDNYVVTVYLPDAVNPGKDSGAYAKIFNFITVDDVEKTYAPKVGATVSRNNIEVKYSGCYAKAVISPDGKLQGYETYVTCVMNLKEAKITDFIKTDVEITLASDTQYTDFVH